LKVSTAAGVGDGDTMRGGVGTPTAVGLGLGVGDKAGEGETVGVAVGGGVGPLFELVISFGYKSTPATPTTSNKTKRTPIRATTHGHLGFALGWGDPKPCAGATSVFDPIVSAMARRCVASVSNAEMRAAPSSRQKFSVSSV